MALRGRLVTITLVPMRSAVCRHVAIPQSSRVEIELQWTRRGRQVSFGRHECAQRQNALAQAKLGRVESSYRTRNRAGMDFAKPTPGSGREGCLLK
jgi:hypothetical protein